MRERGKWTHETEPETLHTLGRRMAAYGDAVAPLIHPDYNMESTVRARRIMDSVAQQLVAGQSMVQLPGQLVGADTDIQDYFPLKVTGNHYLFVPTDLALGSEYGMTGMAFSREYAHFLQGKQFLNEAEMHYLPKPQGYDPKWFLESTATVMLPDTQTNQATSWVDDDGPGFVLGPKVANFWQKVPWGGNREHEFNHKKRALLDPLGYYLGENPHSLADEMLALEEEWYISRLWEPIAGGIPQDADGPPGEMRISRTNNFSTVNPFNLTRQMVGMKYVFAETPIIAQRHVAMPMHHYRIANSQMASSNFCLTTVNQHLMSEMPQKFKPTDFDRMDGRRFNQEAYFSRSVLALWNEALKSSMISCLSYYMFAAEREDFLRGDINGIWDKLDIMKNLKFTNTDFRFKITWRRDLHKTIHSVNRHLTLTEMLDTYYSSMAARVMQDTLFPQHISTEQLINIAEREAPDRLKQRQDIYQVTDLRANIYSSSCDIRNFLLLPLLGDIVFERLMEAGGMRDRTEKLWLETGEQFFERTIAKMQTHITPDGVPLMYQQPNAI